MSEQNYNITELQKAINTWIQSTKKGYFSELSNLAQLTEEVGELARIINRLYGDQTAKDNDNTSKESLADELADIIFVTICLANQTNTDLNQAIQKNLQKKSIRDKNRHS